MITPHACIFTAALLALFVDCGLTNADESIELIGTVRVAGDTLDKSGRHEQLEPEVWHDSFGGISALEYLGKDNLFLALPDRGPKDGAVQWLCRVHVVRISLQPSEESKSGFEPRFSLVRTIFLKDGERFFSGAAADLQPSENRTARLDPEGIRIGDDDNFFLSDEYGPHLLEFSLDGELRRRLAVPARYQIENPCLTKEEENKTNRSGRQGNRGLEGLARNGDPHLLFGLFQSPLLQDCRKDQSGKPNGMNCRLVEFDTRSESVREFLYPLDEPGNKLNEIMGLDDGSFLVIERDGEAGAKARFKKIMRVTLAGATEIQDRDTLPVDQLPHDVRPIRKQTFLDLLDERFALAGDAMPEKIEGLSPGPVLADGRQTLLVASDNDFITKQPTMFYYFAIGHPKEVSAGDGKSVK